MQQLKVEIKIFYPSGAVLSPSPVQTKEIEAFVVQLCTGEKHKKTFLGAKRWTPEEDTLIRSEMAKTDHNKMSTRLSKELAQQLGRTPASINSRSWHITHGKV